MTVRLLGPAEIRALAEQLDVTPTKKLGQNFVIDANTVRRIVKTAGVQPGDHEPSGRDRGLPARQR